MTARTPEIPDFDENSETVKWFAMAKRYMMAARTLRLSPDYAAGRALFVPTLHVTAQGIEVLLKANLIGSGLTANEVKAVGHDIWRLWQHPKNERLRDQALVEATAVYERAKADKPAVGYADDFEEDPQALVVEYLKALSVLHTRESEFALRYVSGAATEAPRPHLLAETFFEVADLCIRQPKVLLYREPGSAFAV